MKPSHSCNIIRGVLKALGSSARTDADGVVVSENGIPNPHDYHDVESWKTAWQVYNVARKRVVAKPELRDKAISRFYEVERKNAALNRRPDPLPDWVCVYLLRAQQICGDIIGMSPNMKQVFSNAVFTGGASTSRTRSRSHPALKWWARPQLEVTPLALRHLLDLKNSSEIISVAWDNPGILSSTTYDRETPFYRIVPGSRFETVTKDAGTDRTILIEPDGNMLLQRGVGITFRKCLKRIGIDLQNQSHNQWLAYVGSIDNSIATVDMRDASNSLYRLLLALVMPLDWYELLLDLRSPICLMPDGNWHTLEMISSMGNGYTFELESLLFYCLSQAVVDLNRSGGKVSVYGDDIIIPTSCMSDLASLFLELGLEINYDKTFSSGSFRESCGAHFFSGVNVTPFYIKEDLVNEQLIRCANQYHSWCTDGDFLRLPDDAHHRAMLLRIIDAIPKDMRNQVPLEYSNTSGLYSPLYSRPIRVRRNRKGYTVATFTYLRTQMQKGPVVEDELRWLYAFVQHHESTSLSINRLSTSLYEIRCPRQVPLSLGRDGELSLKTVSIPLTGGLIP